MGRRGKRYSTKFRDQMLRLIGSGRTPEDLAREFEPSAQAIRNWVKQAELDEGSRSDGLRTDEREELALLRRENKRLIEEREILSKAAARFAQETEKKSKGSSRSGARTRLVSRSARCAVCWKSPPVVTTRGADERCRCEQERTKSCSKGSKGFIDVLARRTEHGESTRSCRKRERGWDANESHPGGKCLR